MKLTKEEKELILKQRAEADASRPKYSGVAKHDLFYLSIGRPEIVIDLSKIVREKGYVVSGEVKEKIINLVQSEIDKSIKLVIKKGSPFNCFIFDGDKLWYDSLGFVEEYEEKWALENLEDIKPV